ncbi:hypothetical protein SAMN05421773_101739 [Streptomyces aidingensis]|uniref:Beta/Gamma crystallin n=1 Tax=Streptomyces aidingensis TaxID=910347 RepID=A0A1I1FP61_9ACTN|nr:hypothetical protein SAMN05421773_101739 [Streptomyces aidingensis]
MHRRLVRLTLGLSLAVAFSTPAATAHANTSAETSESEATAAACVEYVARQTTTLRMLTNTGSAIYAYIPKGAIRCFDARVSGGAHSDCGTNSRFWLKEYLFGNLGAVYTPATCWTRL